MTRSQVPDAVRGCGGVNWHRAIAAGAFAAQALGGHRLGVIGPQRDGMNLVTGVHHQRGIDRSHRAAADHRNLGHFALRARGREAQLTAGEIKTAGSGTACRLADVTLQSNLSVATNRKRLGVDTMLDLKNSRRQRLRRVVIT